MVVVNVTPRVLILGGTTEARRLADHLVARGDINVVSSLAGRVASPLMPTGQVRVGGFAGATGLKEWIRAHEIRAFIDATPSFRRHDEHGTLPPQLPALMTPAGASAHRQGPR